jgi:hypothetical protein
MFGTPGHHMHVAKAEKPGAADTGFSISMAPSGMRAMRCRAALKGSALSGRNARRACAHRIVAYGDFRRREGLWPRRRP